MTTMNHNNVYLSPGLALGEWEVGQGHHPHHTDEETEAQRVTVTEPGATPMSPDSSQIPSSAALPREHGTRGSSPSHPVSKEPDMLSPTFLPSA